MSVLDLHHPRSTWSGIETGTWDVCVIGTGPAGSTVTRELAGSGLRVLVLESGGRDREASADALNDVDDVGRPRNPDQWAVRNRILGGSSHTWGGRCAPFDDIDLQARSWVPGSGWPVTMTELTPYLDRSAEHLGLAFGTGFTDDAFWALAGRRRPQDLPSTDPALLLPFFWQFSRARDESYPFEYVRFGRTLEDHVGEATLVLGATVTQVVPDGHGERVVAVDVAAPDGSPVTVSVRSVVLATGGVENARILLTSDAVTPGGLGNHHDQVGRYLMDHPRGPAAHFPIRTSATLQKRLGRYTVADHLFRAGYRLSPEIQEAEELLNCSAWLGEVRAEDDPWDALRRVVGRRSVSRSDAAAVLRNAPLLARGVRDHLIEHNGIPRKLKALDLDVMVEQRPDPESRVTLGDRMDRFGVRLPRIDWRVHPDEGRTVRRMAELVVSEFARIGLPSPVLADWVRAGAGLPTTFRDVAHPTGSTRMAADPRSGVVDRDCQVHGVQGLYVAGSSTFPTAGHCNPTQMIVAMAVRLADHLRTRVQETIAPTVAAASPAPAADPQPIGGSSTDAAPAGVTVLLTGARGRIGRHVLDDLRDRGYQVRAVSSGSAGSVPRAGDPGVEWRQVDLGALDAPAAVELVTGCDAVVHLAAELGNMSRMQRVNVDATRLLAEAGEAAGLRSFVYTSSVSVYGSSRRRLLDEEGPTLTVDQDRPTEYLALPYVRMYGRTKLAGEIALREVARATRYCILRPAVVVDVADVAATARWSRTKRLLGGHRHAHHVYVGDVSAALVWGVERGLGAERTAGSVELFNVAEDDIAHPRHHDFWTMASEAAGRRRALPAVPGVVDWLHDIVRFRILSTGNPLWRLRFSHRRLLAAGFRFPVGMERVHALALAELGAGPRASSGPTVAVEAHHDLQEAVR